MGEVYTWLTETLVGSVQDVINEMLEGLFNIILTFFTDIEWITESKEVIALINVIIGISCTLLVLMFLKQIFSTFVLETSGDADGDPLQIVVKIFISLALITSHPFIFNSIMTISDATYNVINDAMKLQSLELADISGGLLSGIGSLGILPLLWIIVYTVYILMLIFKALKRAIELAFLKLLFPLFCIDLVTTGSERFSTYMASYLVVAFGYIIQIICIRLSMNMVILNEMMKAIALLIFATKAPEWLSKYTYSSGAGAKTSGIAKSAASTGVQLLRFVK